MSDYAVVNPAMGETVKTYPTISDQDLEVAIARADNAHREWTSSTTVKERAALLRRVGELHGEQRQRLGEIIVREMGKPIEQAVGEVDFCIAIYDYQVARFAGPNLAIGNTILLKHAPQCPESAEAIEQIFHEAGFHHDAYINIYATNEQIETVIADPRMRGVSLTGSERAGAAVAEIAGRNLKMVVLELGGSDPSSS